MVFILLTMLFSILLGAFLVLSDDNATYAGPAIFFSLCAVACCYYAVERQNQLVARRQLLEQKCIQAGIAEMKSVTTEARFEFTEVSSPAEKPEP